MNPNYCIFNCYFKERQLSEGEHGFLAAREVVQAICDADFRNHSLNLINPMNNMIFHHEFLKQPKNGLYLMKVVNPLGGLGLKVLFDTGMYPNYILIEKNPQNPKASLELAMVMQYSLNKAAESLGWMAKVKKSCLRRDRNF